MGLFNGDEVGKESLVTPIRARGGRGGFYSESVPRWRMGATLAYGCYVGVRVPRRMLVSTVSNE
jgi:hypothetical protein